MPQNLDQPAAPAAKNEQMTVVRIALQRLLHQQCQTVKTFADVRMSGRQPHLHTRRDEYHYPRPSNASAKITARAGATPSGRRSTRPLRSTTSITGPTPMAVRGGTTAPSTEAIATGAKRHSSALDRTPARACRRHR